MAVRIGMINRTSAAITKRTIVRALGAEPQPELVAAVEMAWEPACDPAAWLKRFPVWLPDLSRPVEN
jgi:hypothetical protein